MFTTGFCVSPSRFTTLTPRQFTSRHNCSTSRRRINCMTRRLHSSASERNKIAITEVLQRLLEDKSTEVCNLLEISSGTGQHAAHFGVKFPTWRIQPSDCDATYISSIHSWTENISNIEQAIHLDVTQDEIPLPSHSYDVVYNANMIHISPWPSTTIGLMRVASTLLREDNGLLIMYGPYFVNGVTSQSNIDFSTSLNLRDANWGVRELNQVQQIALNHGLYLREIVSMPANNLCVVYSKQQN